MIFDFKNPDYPAVMRLRAAKLAALRKDPGLLREVKLYYREAPWEFVNDWGMTHDPRNADVGLPSVIPFVLMPRQIEWGQWVYSCWRRRKNGATEKSRDMGMSWLSVGFGAALCMLYDDLVIGYGSRKEDLVDLKGSPKSLFHRARFFVNNIPVEFKGEWDEKIHAPNMRIMFPTTRSVMLGEGGDSIGRGDRASIYFVDEAEFLEQPELTEASLSNTTNCRQDISSVNGSTNPIARKILEGRVEHFIFSWRDDLRKGEDWYKEQQAKMDPVVLAQEVDMDRSASQEGIIIPSAWVQAAIDFHLKHPALLNGRKLGALDVADEGRDKNSYSITQGRVLLDVISWSGKGSDIQATTERAFVESDKAGIDEYYYDADGLGASVRGDARIINERRVKTQRMKFITVKPFRGSGKLVDPRKEYVKGRKNEDMFQNFKAQSYWWLRMLFENTWLASQERPHDENMLISISSNVTDLQRLLRELSQPTMGWSVSGKMVVDKMPDGALSPNMSDSVMMNFAPKKFTMQINSSIASRLGASRNGPYFR